MAPECARLPKAMADKYIYSEFCWKYWLFRGWKFRFGEKLVLIFAIITAFIIGDNAEHLAMQNCQVKRSPYKAFMEIGWKDLKRFVGPMSCFFPEAAPYVCCRVDYLYQEP